MAGERLGARIQRNLLAGGERRLLTKLCALCPPFVTPDLLTTAGFAGACIVFVGYGASRFADGFLLLAVFGYFLHWLGDSLDGSLARYRGIERPRYGYFVDHGIDQLGNFLIMSGLGLSNYVRLDVALLTIGGYMMLSIYVFLKKQVMDSFEMSFVGIGPTELRIALAALTLSMPFVGRLGLGIGGQYFTVYDGLLLLAASAFLVIFVWNFLSTAKSLRDEGT
jgi:archaetidylinositol phosphate synthase